MRKELDVSTDSVRNARRRLRQIGVNPDTQRQVDLACVHPHIHPRHTRNAYSEDLEESKWIK